MGFIDQVNIGCCQLAFDPNVPPVKGNVFLQGFFVQLVWGDDTDSVHVRGVEFDCLGDLLRPYQGKVLFKRVFPFVQNSFG